MPSCHCRLTITEAGRVLEQHRELLRVSAHDHGHGVSSYRNCVADHRVQEGPTVEPHELLWLTEPRRCAGRKNQHMQARTGFTTRVFHNFCRLGSMLR